MIKVFKKGTDYYVLKEDLSKYLETDIRSFFLSKIPEFEYQAAKQTDFFNIKYLIQPLQSKLSSPNKLFKWKVMRIEVLLNYLKSISSTEDYICINN